MKLYADAPVRRARQITGDVLLVGWLILWWLVARAVHGATLMLAEPGRRMNAAGTGLAAKLRDAGSVVDGTPFIGDKLRAPLDGAGSAANQFADAGTSQVEAVQHLAFWLSLSIGAIPILIALAVYVPARWRFARQATAAQRFIDAAADLDLFALRALARQPMHRLAGISDDPAGAWWRGDPAVVRELATLELRDAGLRPPQPVEAG